MPKSHPRYPPESRRQIIELVRRERTIEEISREFGRLAGALLAHRQHGRTMGVDIAARWPDTRPR